MASRIGVEGSEQASVMPGAGSTPRGRLELVGKIESYEDTVNMAVIIPREDGIICEFKVGDDYNKVQHVRDYPAHTGRVNAVLLVDESILLSCGSDKCFQINCTETGQRLTGYQLNASGSCLQYDSSSKYVFIGDNSGQITVFKLDADKIERLTTLKRHTASVQCMTLDKSRRLLFSASHDQSIVVWNLKTKDFAAFELHGHLDKVRGISFCENSNQLLSVGEDCVIVCWDMTKFRDPPAKWNESDVCESCSTPFFWNVKSMWETKSFGGRQHHCRKCGKALCAKCSAHSDAIPQMGFELQVRVCDNCHNELEAEKQTSLATFHDLRHAAVYLNVDENSRTILTTGKDRVIKLWDASTLLQLPRQQVLSAIQKK